LINIRSFASDKRKKIDDKPFGGGCGMVMKIEPLYFAIKSILIKRKSYSYKNIYEKPYVIYMSPQGKTLKNSIIKKLIRFKHIVILCGHYEGVDERIMNYVDEEISIGDYVLSGGEIPAMVLINTLSRMLPGVIEKYKCIINDSFYKDNLDYPCYTRPAIFKNLKVPEVLLSGNHKEIEKWKKKIAYERTKKRRPDLLKKSKKDF
jgi:tRNA (guanine37-N1)-methyltransferase